MKRSWNALIGVLERRTAGVARLLDAARAGELGAPGRPAPYAGADRRLMEHMNALLEAVDAPLREIVAVMERLAARDDAGDFERARAAIDATAAALAQVRAGMDAVAVAAGEIASGSQSVATGASEQASSLEETSASLESMGKAGRARPRRPRP